jgi:preprotein translocase subunit SecF
MLIGFVVGVCTSIFVASPITMDLIINSEKKQTEVK